MENYNQGDLMDILRATGSVRAKTFGQEWQFSSNPMDCSPDPAADDFGNPFTGHFRDPLLHDHIIQATPVSGFSFSSYSIVEDSSGNSGEFATARLDLDHDHNKMKVLPSSSIFSRMLQISPNAPRGSPAINTLISPNNGLQISPPRNTGIKRRKSQAKKVVCIPAPAPANSRPSSGEIVPSDLWAWRKYGQKPIKGSPYPRGYYRCSSSKGCSARKQVERSRTDPNMLVITYTSEHNHPWPTQRNALAGSTRAHNPTKKSPPNYQNLKDEQIMENTAENTAVDPDCVAIKAEMDQDDQFEMDDQEFDDGFPQGYKPPMADGSSNPEDRFFADLGEIDGDPLDMLFTQGYAGGEDPGNKGFDPFGFNYWGANNSNAASRSTNRVAATYEEDKGDSL